MAGLLGGELDNGAFIELHIEIVGGALYMGFAVLNWMAKDNLIGGITAGLWLWETFPISSWLRWLCLGVHSRN
jgi:hypothetical protein